MRIDLHTHSDRSDGTIPPREVVREAARVGLDVLGLTDHDTAEGWDEAAETAHEVGLTLVRGMEISCRLGRRSSHLLAYLPDPTYPPLVGALQTILSGRDGRMPDVCAKLRELGIDIREADVVARAGDAAAIGRPHIADVLVGQGVVASRDEAFDTYLSPGRPAYVHRYAAPVEEMIGIVRDAGGVSVLAHPWGRGGSAGLHADELAVLRDAGLAGIEVDHQDHGVRERAELRELGRELGLVMTGSSDFHGAGKVDHELGCNTTEPEQFEALLDRIASAAAAADRRTPDVVRP